MSSPTSSRRTIIIATIISVVVALCTVAVVAVSHLRSDPESTSPADNAAPTDTSAPPSRTDEFAPPTATGAAGWDENQRHFKRRYFDDSHFEVGEYSADNLGRPAFMPHHIHGDNFGKLEQVDAIDCSSKDTLIGQQQYVHGRYMLVSEHDGPSDFSTMIPVGYAKTAAGAATAASNIMTMGMLYQDYMGVEYLRKYAKSQSAQELVDRGPATAIPPRGGLPVMDAYKIESCGGDVATVLVALKDPSVPEASWSVMRIPMRFKNGAWTLVMSQQDEQRMEQPPVGSLDGFTRVVLQ